MTTIVKYFSTFQFVLIYMGVHKDIGMGGLMWVGYYHILCDNYVRQKKELIMEYLILCLYSSFYHGPRRYDGRDQQMAIFLHLLLLLQTSNGPIRAIRDTSMLFSDWSTILKAEDLGQANKPVRLYSVHTVQCTMYTLYKPTAGNQFSCTLCCFLITQQPHHF